MDMTLYESSSFGEEGLLVMNQSIRTKQLVDVVGGGDHFDMVDAIPNLSPRGSFEAPNNLRRTEAPAIMMLQEEENSFDDMDSMPYGLNVQ